MSKASKPLVFPGDSISYLAGETRIDLLCVRPGLAYRVSICHGGTGAETSLSRSFATEPAARESARGWAKVFNTGARVVDVIDLLAALDSLPLHAA